VRKRRRELKQFVAHEQSTANPILPLIKVVGAFGMFLFLFIDDATGGLDFSVRMKGSLAGTLRAVFELDVLV
jgi:hypothetical protein